MRIPLVRLGDDDTPIAMWELLFIPLMVPLLLVFLLVAAVASIPLGFINRFRMQREEKKLRQQLEADGRFLEWDEVERKLKSGDGTLIIEHRSPKGPIREWWTDEDVIGSAPVSLPTMVKELSPKSELKRLQKYARTCVSKYVDVASGTAKLTAVAVPLHAKLDPRKMAVVDLGGGVMTAILLPTGRQLAQRYPEAKIVTLITWIEEPILVIGDAENAFLDQP